MEMVKVTLGGSVDAPTIDMDDDELPIEDATLEEEEEATLTAAGEPIGIDEEGSGYEKTEDEDKPVDINPVVTIANDEVAGLDAECGRLLDNIKTTVPQSIYLKKVVHYPNISKIAAVFSTARANDAEMRSGLEAARGILPDAEDAYLAQNNELVVVLYY